MDNAFYGLNVRAALRSDFCWTKTAFNNHKPGKIVDARIKSGTLDTAAIQKTAPFELSYESQRYRALVQYLLSTKRQWIRPLTYTFPCRRSPLKASKIEEKLKFDTPISMRTVAQMAIDLIKYPVQEVEISSYLRDKLAEEISQNKLSNNPKVAGIVYRSLPIHRSPLKKKNSRPEISLE